MIEKLLNEDMIQTGIDVKSWQEAARYAGSILKNNGLVEEAFIESMINTVNKYGPYVVLIPQVAFFHGEPSPNVHKLCMSLVTFKDPVYFKEFNNEEIRCAFAFGAVDKESHLNILMEVAKLFQDIEFVDLIVGGGSKEDILDKLNNFSREV